MLGFRNLGDLNFHYLCEDSTILENHLLDLWAESHFDEGSGTIDEGYTYDSQTNLMVPRYVVGENRRMRLDRILCALGNRRGAFWVESEKRLE